MAGDERVEISIKAIGPSPPSSIRVPSLIKVSDLRSLVSLDRQLPKDRLKLILKGKILNDENEDGEDVNVRFNNGDSLVVAVMPKPPAKHLQEDDDEEEDLRFQMPQSSSWWKRRMVSFLRNKLRFPDFLLIAIFSISLKAWACIFLWFSLAPVAHRWDLGPLYILGTGFFIILLNLGKRQQGDVSAYSIFNEDFRELPGTLNADRLDRDIRAGYGCLLKFLKQWSGRRFSAFGFKRNKTGNEKVSSPESISCAVSIKRMNITRLELVK